MAEITTNTPPAPQNVPQYIWILLGLLAIAAYLSGLWLPLVGPDEPRYAQVAREMLERGDWITPTLGGHPWFEKPALLYWLEIASYKVLGVNEFAARFGPALFGLATVAALSILGKALTQRADWLELSKWLGLISASTLGILVFAHGASFDIIITFPMTAALVSFFYYERAAAGFGKNSRRPLALFYVFVGLSLLAKGLIGIIFPFAIVGLFYTLSRRVPQRTFMLSLGWGTILALAIASIWYLPVYVQNGWPFVDEFFVQHHFERFLSNRYQHPQPFYFFFWVLPLMTLPWLPFVILGAVDLFKARVRKNEPSVALLCAAWIAVPLMFFSLSGSKLPGYILPAVPPAIVITALFINRLSRESKFWKTAALSLAALTLAGATVLMFTVIPRFADAESVRPLITAAEKMGMGTDRVFALHNVPQGAEFYAAGRLLRDVDGKQKRLYSVAELKTEMERAGVDRSLVVVPLEAQEDLSKSKLVRSEFIADNGELAIYSVHLD